MCGIHSPSRNAVVVERNGRAAVLSWDGFQATHAPRIKTGENEVQAYALYLEKHGLLDEALAVLEDFCAGRRVTIF